MCMNFNVLNSVFPNFHSDSLIGKVSVKRGVHLSIFTYTAIHRFLGCLHEIKFKFSKNRAL